MGAVVPLGGAQAAYSAGLVGILLGGQMVIAVGGLRAHVGEMRVNTRQHNELQHQLTQQHAETREYLTLIYRDLSERLDKIETSLDGVDQRMTDCHDRLTEIRQALQRLDGLEQRMSQRLDEHHKALTQAALSAEDELYPRRRHGHG